MLSVEDWAEIRRLHRAERMPIKVIARVLGVSKNTVKAALRSDGPPRYDGPLRGSLVDAAEPRIRELLQAYPTMPATVVAERIGWTHSIRILRDGWPSCGRCICRPTRPPAPRTRPQTWRSATCGSCPSSVDRCPARASRTHGDEGVVALRLRQGPADEPALATPLVPL